MRARTLLLWLAVACDGVKPSADDTARPGHDSSGAEACETPSAAEGPAEVVASCEAGALGTVEDPWNVVVEWGWGDHSLGQGSWVMPAVGNVDDDDGDGDIDADDIPDIAVGTWTDGLVVLSGDGGGLVFDYPRASPKAGVAIGDIDGDAAPEVVTATVGGDLVAVDDQGAELWRHEGLDLLGYVQPSLADLDADGDVEVVVESGIYDGLDGAEVVALGTRPFLWTTTVVADLDQDGCQEVLVGAEVYDCAGAPKWSASGGVGAQFPAVVQADDDDEAEVLLFTSDITKVSENRVTLLEADGTEISSFTTGGVSSGPPCAADFDGDGVMEFGLPDGDTVGVYERDGSARWTAPVTDISGLAGCSGFDVDGDGASEVLFADEEAVYLFDGATGATRWTSGDHRSGTIYEYPTVADVDRDGAAEIVVVSGGNEDGTWSGLVVYGHAGSGWPDAGPGWGVHDYRATNQEDDGHIPALPGPSWLDPGVFRARPALPVEARADLIVEILGTCADECLTEPVSIGYQVSNQGAADVEAGVPLALYAVGETEDFLVQVVELPALPAGTAVASGAIEVAASYFSVGGFRLVIDDDGAGQGVVRECDEHNNAAAQAGPICEL